MELLLFGGNEVVGVADDKQVQSNGGHLSSDAPVGNDGTRSR